MPKATKEITTTRRALALAGGALASIGLTAGAAATVAGLAPHPDAELIAVCAEFIVCNQTFCSLYDGPNPVEDEDEAYQIGQPYLLRQDVLLDRMRELRATTAPGIQARAQALAEHSGHWEFGFEDRETVTGRLLDYLMRDAQSSGGPGRPA